MNYLSENMTPLDASVQSTINKMIFEFRFHNEIEKSDYFLVHKINWQILTAGIYKFQIGDCVHSIPSGHFVMIGDENGDMDWITVDEMVGREIECVRFGAELGHWDVKPAVLLDYFEGQYYWPTTAHAVPIINNNRVIMVSERDHYHKIKDCGVDLFLGNH